MREIGRQCPPAQLILHQCCLRCLTLYVMRNLAVEREQCLNLSSSAPFWTQVDEHVFFPHVTYIYMCCSPDVQSLTLDA